MKYFYVRRFILKDGAMQDLGVVDIPENHLEETLKMHPNWILDGEVGATPMIKLPEAEKKFECPICGREFKNETGLKIHKKSHI